MKSLVIAILFVCNFMQAQERKEINKIYHCTILKTWIDNQSWDGSQTTYRTLFKIDEDSLDGNFLLDVIKFSKMENRIIGIIVKPEKFTNHYHIPSYSGTVANQATIEDDGDDVISNGDCSGVRITEIDGFYRMLVYANSCWGDNLRIDFVYDRKKNTKKNVSHKKVNIKPAKRVPYAGASLTPIQ